MSQRLGTPFSLSSLHRRFLLLILRRVNAFLRVTKRFAPGDFSARTGVAYGEGELGQLGQAFDEMAESFEKKEAGRKHAEEALRESERKYRDLVDNALVGVYKTNLRGEIIYANEALLRIFEYDSPEEMMASGVVPRYKHPEERERFINPLKKAGHVKSFDAELLTKTGRIKNVLISGTLDGEIISGMVLDITERKQVEEALRESEERYRSLFNDVPVGLYRTTPGGRILDANHTLAQLLGYPDRESLLAITTFDTYVDQKVHAQRRASMDRDGILRNFEYQLRRCDGSIIWVEGNSKTILDGEGKVLYYEGTLADITERKKAEQELSDLQEQLRQSQKMEAIGRLAGGIAHDFNNLLTVIKGYSQLSLIELKEEDPVRANVEETKKAADRAADLVRQLLAFSRRQIMEMKVIDLNGLLQDLEKMLQRVIGEEIDLVTQLDRDLGRIKVDPGQMEQVIMNLAVNAKDAMPNGGKLFIETANAELDEAYARTHIAVIPGRYVRLSITDTGVGIKPEVRNRVFEPFFTTKEKGKGTGLGLSTVYGIVKQSGGNIWVYSEPGQGTTIKIYLPRVDEPLAELREKTTKQELPRGKETILIVEDDGEVRKLAAQILEGQGYKVLKASDGGEALRLFKEKEQPVHLVLSDVVMPGMSGRELARRVMLIHPKIKVLYMSGYTDHAIVHRGFLKEGVDYVQKPFTVDGLARKVREVLDR
jgi:PAS domain S-box-containing protein